MKELKGNGKKIIWIDGTYGVGKSKVARRIKETVENLEIELLESDVYFKEALHELVEESIRKNSIPLLGAMPQNNIALIIKIREVMQEKLNENKTIIVDMALTRQECKIGLYEYFQTANVEMMHVILTADEETIISRIENDNTRDKQLALDNLQYNIWFLNENYNDAIRIDTTDMSIDDVANKIVRHLQ